MSNIDFIVEERSVDIGDYFVGRLLPFLRKKTVGPFIYIDHFGPGTLGPQNYSDVNQHPHIGLSTLTYLLEGEVMHRDSIGTEQRITPGAINFMTAGKGITHTERTPEDLRDGRVLRSHGYQIWVALPKELEDMEPTFVHVEEKELPIWEDGNAQFKLVAGEGFGRSSPLPVYSELFMVELKTTADYHLKVNGEVKGEIGVIVVEGAVEACGESIEKGKLMISKAENVCEMEVTSESHLILFGGVPFPEKRYIDWNFVSHSKEKIKEAKERWKNKEFPKVPNDETYIPLPERKF